MHGMFAVCLSHERVVGALKVNKNEWIRAQIPVALPIIIDALKLNLVEIGTPAIMTLAALEAFREKYGDDFYFLNMKEDMPLFNPKDGSPLNEQAKICLAHGAAVEYFTEIKDVLEQNEELYQKMIKGN